MKRLLLLMAGVILLLVHTYAQSRIITGKLTDANDQPVSGASVQIKGSTTGTTSGADGTFASSGRWPGTLHSCPPELPLDFN